MKNFQTIIISIIVLVLTAASLPGADKSNQSVKIDINSDFISYDNTKAVVISSGNVGVLYKNIKLNADSLTYNRNSGKIKAFGNISFETENYSLNSKSIIYNIFSSTGRVFAAKVAAEPLYIYADEIEIRSKTVFFIPQGDITTCNHQPPHYKFSGKNILVDTESKFRIVNMLMTVRGVPAFYSPYYSKTIGPKKSKFDMELGESDREGYFVKTKYSYPFTQNSRTYMGVDYMNRRGIGLKAGHGYSSSGGKLDLDWYYVNEKETLSDTQDEKYTRNSKLNLSGWQKINEVLRIRGNAEYVDDRTFNYNYVRDEGVEYYQQQLNTQASLEYSRAVYFASVFIDKEEEWADGGYRVKRYILPGLRLRLFPVGLPLNSNFSADSRYHNRYMTAKENWQPYFDWKTKIVTTHRNDFTKNYFLTVTPGFGYSGDYIRYSADDDILTHYISLFAGVKQGFFNNLFFDSDYQWKREAAKPYTIVISKLDQKATYRPFKPLTLSTRSSYDFRKDILYRFGAFTIIPGLQFYSEKSSVKRWDYKFDRFVRKSLTVKWDMHCWESNLRFIQIGDEYEFWLLFNIIAFPDTKTGLYGNILTNDKGEITETDYRFHRESSLTKKEV
jgi:lipopolysaccharide assembly outer membrane protein LptD (OstA)